MAGEKNYGVKLWAGNYGGEMGGGNILEKNKAKKKRRGKIEFIYFLEGNFLKMLLGSLKITP